jgi:hypothetical protein
MSLFRNKLANSLVIASAALAMILSASACNSSDFAGGNGKGGLSLDGKDGKGGKGKDDANDDGNDGTTSGAPEGGTAEGLEGNEAGGKDGIEGGDDNGDDGDGVEGNDDSADDGGEPEAGGDDGEVTKKTRSDLKITQTREDDKHQIKVDLLIKGKVSKSQQVPSPGKGKDVILKEMCRVGLSTCLKVTFIGKLTQVAGAASCVFTSPMDEKSVKIDVDTNGAGFLGSCKPDEDETLIFSCDEAKSLKVQGCNS